MTKTHILTPLALEPSIRIEASADVVAAEMDVPVQSSIEQIMIQEIQPHWANRFAIWENTDPPSTDELNLHLSDRLDYIRRFIPNQADVGQNLASRFLSGHYDCGVLLLVDGLSFLECTNWIESPTPCFVDGPSITEFGFTQIIQSSGLVKRFLNSNGLQLRAYSYWQRKDNDLTARLFNGVPVQAVRNFNETIARLDGESLKGRFIFILREGLDELAHRQRELPKSVRSVAVDAVQKDLQLLGNLMRAKGHHALIALVADHGIAWRDDRQWQVVEGSDQSWHGRYSERPPSGRGLATILGGGSPPFYCYHPGLLCRGPRSNEAGFHGGLSAEESFVPYVILEV